MDCPGDLHHIVIRGIESKTIFKNDTDREDFIGGSHPEAKSKSGGYVRKWSANGRCHELIGGELICSVGGWHAVKEAYRAGGFGLQVTSTF